MRIAIVLIRERSATVHCHHLKCININFIHLSNARVLEIINMSSLTWGLFVLRIMGNASRIDF